MTYIVSITSQGQISIPARIRRELGLKKNTKALVSKQEGKLIIEPVKDLLQLRGSIKTNKKPLSNKQVNEIVAQGFADEYTQKFKRIK